MSVTLSENTPLLIQYREIKSRHRDAILFFRMGDFYEMFFDDAELASRVLSITLTSRGDGVPLAGVPVKAAADYLRQLVGQGHRVAICEQVEDPKKAKGLVRREVVETVTPGALLEEGWVAGGRNNWIVAVNTSVSRYVGKSVGIPATPTNLPTYRPTDLPTGLAAIDLTTGEFLLESVPAGGLAEALGRLTPAELVLPPDASVPLGPEVMQTVREAWEFDPALAREEIARRFRLASLEGLGLGDEDDPAVGAAGALLRYLGDLKPSGLPHLGRPTVRRSGRFLWLDEMTRRNLELVEPLRAGAKGVTLLEVIDRTVTPMGARLLRSWVLSPLSDPTEINGRLDAVDAAVGDPLRRAGMREALDGIRDLERLAGRAAAGRATPRELGALRDSFLQLPDVHQELRGLVGRTDIGDGEVGEDKSLSSPLSPPSSLSVLLRELDLLADLVAILSAALTERPPAMLGDGNVIKSGYDPELDESRSLRDGGKQNIAAIQHRERDRTGISSLKIGYNKVFGYFIEVTNTHTAKVPTDYERRQTLATAERYVTPELKEYEAKVLGAEERVAEREAELFAALRSSIGGAIARIQQSARVLAQLDAWTALAEVAVANRYARPEIHDGFDIKMTASRHPVIERMMPREAFMPNDITFDAVARVQLVTGPNMAGKSTILRQIGQCVILAQMGSFVPCEKASIGVVDRLFTRVGASDNLTRGQSTFMVEMSETSAILHGATPRSLVLLDEIGRGTSTYDGVAIAWAVTEFIHDKVGAKTMFATHYHELMQLPETLQHARNFNVAVRETGGKVVFLHRLEPGGTDRSYGIHVAELAGLPREVVTRANAVLKTLEGNHRVVAGGPAPDPDPGQLPLFSEAPPDPALVELRAMNLEAMTPLEALNRLSDLQKKAGGR